MNLLNRAIILAEGNLPDTTPETPPGMDKLSTIISWVSWGVSIICLISFLVCIGWLAWSAFQGQEVRAGKGMVIALVAMILLGAAGAVIGALV